MSKCNLDYIKNLENQIKTMCGIQRNAALDAAIMQGALNLIGMAVEACLRENMPPKRDSLSEAYQNADPGQVIAMAAMALKRGSITDAQYEAIFDAAMNSKPFETTATVERKPDWDNMTVNKFLNQFGG